MKKIVFFFLILILAGCSSSSGINTEAIDKVFEDSSSIGRSYRNNYTSLMEYYVPSDVQEMGANEYSVELEYEGTPLVMNVNIAGIITDKYYSFDNLKESLFDSDKLCYSKTGSYTDGSKNSSSFDYRIYSYEDDYLIVFASRKINIYAYATLDKLVPLSSRILILAKGTNVREDTIIASYSSKGVIDYQRKQVDLFENILPVNGRIDDLLVTSDNANPENGVE